MKITPAYINNYNNKPSFGMAFEKPGNEVIAHFRNVLKELPEQKRNSITDQMVEIINEAKTCPEPIKQTLAGSYERHYTPIVDKEYIIINNGNDEAEKILNAMRLATRRARNKYNLDQNIQKLTNAFDINA